MFIPASSEFVALCQSQVAVLTQGLGAALSAVYLTTEELVEGSQPKLIPVVIYPEAAAVWEEDETDLALPERGDRMDKLPQLSKAIPRLLPQKSEQDSQVDSTSPDWQDESLYRQRQIVLPLIHEGVVLGLLVTGREDRPWNDREQAAIERIAQTLTIAYLMDRRRVWFEQQLNQQRTLHAQQRDLLDDILHQFRNPLTALRTFGKLLFKRLLPGDKNREVAASIVRESDRLQELLKEFDESLDKYSEDMDLLTLPAAAFPLPVKDEEGQKTSHANEQPEAATGVLPLLPGKTFIIESFAVAEVLGPLLLSASAIAQERDLQLHFSIPNDLPPVRGNAKALREALNNLIDNALKYTPAGGQIYIQTEIGQHPPQGEMIAIAITDTGPGIPAQDLNHLFERHYRGVQATTSIPGSGLGLAIAKELIEQMHGQIEIFSPAQPVRAKQISEPAIDNTQDQPSKGTTFIVWLVVGC
ncbi:MAG TPA: histidine kinase [Cyanobacteria bacterium UBA8803]|nr:histidine kinase [Cyanobacteria bacterium UBA9273]HBL61290.1 histidine kinase [Cyanobacteria bacterium UBA8803]